MTRQQSFKRRVRRRMAKTGERYASARRALVAQAIHRPGRDWASQPEVTEERVRAATGRGWDEWCDLIDAWPGRDQGHSAIVAYLSGELGVAGWWAQTVTVGYERISGLRLPHQQPDGTFTASKSRTVHVDAAELRSMLLDQSDRAQLFPGLSTALRSRPSSKVVRIGIGPGVAQIDIAPRGDGRVRVTVAHERLPGPGDVELWKAYWSDWLDAIDG